MYLKEGGPGSGVSYKNTTPIDLPLSDYISVGTRKGLQNNMDYDEYDIPLKYITKVGQKTYVPGKVNKFLQNRDWIRSKPIDVLWVRGDGYHMIDGHHRYLAASALNQETIPARVYKKAEKTMPDYVADNPGKDDDIERATRTTPDASNPGLKDDRMIGYVGAAEAMECGDWDRALSLFEVATDHWLDQRVKNPRTGRMIKVRNLPKELRKKYKPEKRVAKDIDKDVPVKAPNLNKKLPTASPDELAKAKAATARILDKAKKARAKAEAPPQKPKPKQNTTAPLSGPKGQAQKVHGDGLSKKAAKPKPTSPEGALISSVREKCYL